MSYLRLWGESHKGKETIGAGFATSYKMQGENHRTSKGRLYYGDSTIPVEPQPSLAGESKPLWMGTQKQGILIPID